MSALGLDLTRNISLFTIPAAFVVALVPHQIAIGMASLSVYDNSQPRNFTERVMKAENLDKPTKMRILRAQGASDNGFETIGLYAAAVVAANAAKIDTELLNLLTLGYIASRVIFVFAYIQLGENRNLSYVRTLLWGAGIGSILTLFIKAGQALY